MTRHIWLFPHGAALARDPTVLLLWQWQQTTFPLLTHLFKGTVTNDRCKPVREGVCAHGSVTLTRRAATPGRKACDIPQWKLLGTDVASAASRWGHGRSKDGSVSYLVSQSVGLRRATQQAPHKPQRQLSAAPPQMSVLDALPFESSTSLLSFTPVLKSNFIGAERKRNEKLTAQFTLKRQFL